MDITINVKGQEIFKGKHPRIYSDSINYIKLIFDFDSDWDNAIKTVIIENGDKPYCILIENDTVVIPANCLSYGDLSVSVFGVIGDMRITTGRIIIPIYQSGFRDGETPPPPKADVYAEIVSSVKNAEAISAKVLTEFEAIQNSFNGISDTVNNIEPRIDEIEKYDKAYDVDISKVGSGNNILYITMDGITNYSQLTGKTILVNTKAYQCTWTTPQPVYLNINGLGSKNIYKSLPCNYTDYDTRQYETNKFTQYEIGRNMVLILTYNGSNFRLSNPPVPPKVTTDITADTTDDWSYATPKKIDKFVNSRVSVLQSSISDLETRIASLEAQIEGIEGGTGGGTSGTMTEIPADDIENMING